MIYADYEFYKGQFYGSLLTSADFMSYASKASDFLDYYTGGKARTSNYTEELAKACCGIADALFKADKVGEGNSLIKSESVGSWSATYVTGEERQQAIRKECVSIARQYLAFTGLLFRGV